MASNFPTSLDSLTDGVANNPLATGSHTDIHNTANDAIEKIEAKVGINGSAVDTSLDYLIKNTTGGHDHDGVDSKTVDGANVINTPAGTIAATDVQAAINELDTEKQAVLSAGLLSKSRQIWLSAKDASVPASAGAAQAQINDTDHSYWTLAFDKATDEHAFWSFIMPPDYDGGNITIRVWFFCTGITSGEVHWSYRTAAQARLNNVDPTLSAEATIDVETVPGTQNYLDYGELVADLGWESGRYIIFKLTRDANNADDTADADANVIGVEILFNVT